MSKRVFSLKFVPNDEANGVRNALEEAGIEYFESPPGYLSSLGLNAAGIWVANNEEDPARTVINAFQKEWLEKIHTESGNEPSASKRADRFMLIFLLGVVVLSLLVISYLNTN